MPNVIRKFVLFLYGEKVERVEGWAKRNAITTPDQIISAYIVELIAKDFDGWRRTMRSNDIAAAAIFRLRHEEKDVNFDFAASTVFLEEDTLRPGRSYVNGVLIADKAADVIYSAYLRVKQDREELERRAREAKKRMEENEKKWDVAEKLLGMKRDRFGILRATQVKYGKVHPASRCVTVKNRNHEFDCDCDHCIC